MPQRAQAAVQAWRDAEQAARQAQRDLKAVWETYFAKRGPAPSIDLIAGVAGLRALAARRLAESMAALKRSGDGT